MGAPHLAACGGKVYWELRVVSAQGGALVGFAGTSFRSGLLAPQGQEALLGFDEAGWALSAYSGKRYHGSVRPPPFPHTLQPA